jgi:hypothetical protein
MTATSELNKLYLKRRSQRANALKKVIRQWHRLEHTERFFGTLEAWHSATEGHFVLDDFLDHVADAINEDEWLLDVAVDRLAAANKRVHDAIEAMDPKLYSDNLPKSVVRAPGGKYDLQQVRHIITQVVTKENLGKQEALSILDEQGGVQTISSLHPENFDKVYEACQSLLDSVGASVEAKRPQVEPGDRKVGHSRKRSHSLRLGK